jgi:hypothetical protein
MPASQRCIFLAGAPEAEDLSWDEENLLLRFRMPITRFLEDGTVLGGEVMTQVTPPSTYAKWRSLSCNQGQIQTDYMEEPPQKMTQFLSFDNEGEMESQDEFLEQSIALLDDLESTHIVPRATMRNADGDGESRHGTTFLSNASFTTNSFSTNATRTSDASFVLPSTENPEILDLLGPVTDLKRIPNADYIFHIQPQTITVNLVVGIIAVSSIRTVRLRRRNAEMDIIDLTVGDETRAGFSISFWLVPVEGQRKPTDDLRQTLLKLRTGDVVVVSNVALSCFKNCVYGQSLSRQFARNSTSISVIVEFAGGGSLQLRAKMERAREWTRDFVGVATRNKPSDSKTRNMATVNIALPPDTQD